MCPSLGAWRVGLLLNINSISAACCVRVRVLTYQKKKQMRVGCVHVRVLTYHKKKQMRVTIVIIGRTRPIRAPPLSAAEGGHTSRDSMYDAFTSSCMYIILYYDVIYR